VLSNAWFETASSKSERRRYTVDAIGRLCADEDEISSEIKLKPFPFTAHYTASGTTSPDGSEAWLDSHHGTADDLSYTVAAYGTNAFCAGETGLKQPRPTAAGAEYFQRVCFATERR